MRVNCFVKEPGKKPCQSTTDTDWESLSDIVGVPTELTRLKGDTGVIFDALGFQKGKDYCCEINGKSYYGTILFVGLIDYDTFFEIAEHPAKNVRDFEANTEIYY